MTALESPPASVPDFAALRSCRHPVAYASALGATPLRVRLLGEDLVVWRDSSGRPHALRDLCIHRGTALSLGRVVGDRLMCPYHGWQYGSDGVCKLIPQLEDPTRVPGKARVDAFRCQERLGMLWVAMDEPRWDLPDVPEFEDDGWTVVSAGPYTWNSDASRQLENFTDFGHFPWVHPGLLGDPSRPVVPEYSVETDGHVLHYQVVRPEARTATTSLSSRTRGGGGPRDAAATTCTCPTPSCCGSVGAARRGWSTSSPRSPSTRTAARAT